MIATWKIDLNHVYIITNPSALPGTNWGLWLDAVDVFQQQPNNQHCGTFINSDKQKPRMEC